MSNLKNVKLRHSLMLIVTALIWGVAFVAQSEGGDAIGPYTFNGIRSIIGGFVLLPVIVIIRKLNRGNDNADAISVQNSTDKSESKGSNARLVLTGILCGTILFFASSFQQMGLYNGTSAGKAGFLTACYIIIVPLLGRLLGKKCGLNIIIGVVLTTIGLYLLCMTDGFGFQGCDVLVMICAVLFSIHILVVDKFSPLVDPVKLSCIQFFTCGILCIVPSVIVDMKASTEGAHELLNNLATPTAWITILYAGIMSCGVAYTFQIVGQAGLNPTVASLLMSLESVFSVIAGWLILNQSLGRREILGCIVMFVAIIIAQLPGKTEKRKKKV